MENKQFKIVLVENNCYDAELMLRSLKKNNLANDIIHIHDGVKALEFFLREGNALNEKILLLDLKMPKLDGLEVLQKLKSNPYTKNIPVIMIASSKDDPALKKCLLLGANGYLVKPVCFESLIKTTSQLGIPLQIIN